jgi:hypothetical protein
MRASASSSELSRTGFDSSAQRLRPPESTLLSCADRNRAFDEQQQRQVAARDRPAEGRGGAGSSDIDLTTSGRRGPPSSTCLPAIAARLEAPGQSAATEVRVAVGAAGSARPPQGARRPRAAQAACVAQLELAHHARQVRGMDAEPARRSARRPPLSRSAAAIS